MQERRRRSRGFGPVYLVAVEQEGRRAEDEVGGARVDLGPARPRGAEHRRGGLGLPATAAAGGRRRRLEEQPVHGSGRHPSFLPSSCWSSQKTLPAGQNSFAGGALPSLATYVLYISPSSPLAAACSCRSVGPGLVDMGGRMDELFQQRGGRGGRRTAWPSPFLEAGGGKEEGEAAMQCGADRAPATTNIPTAELAWGWRRVWAGGPRLSCPPLPPLPAHTFFSFSFSCLPAVFYLFVYL